MSSSFRFDTCLKCETWWWQLQGFPTNHWVVATQRFLVIFTPKIGVSWSNLTSIFFRWVGKNHQLDQLHRNPLQALLNRWWLRQGVADDADQLYHWYAPWARSVGWWIFWGWMVMSWCSKSWFSASRSKGDIMVHGVLISGMEKRISCSYSSYFDVQGIHP